MSYCVIDILVSAPQYDHLWHTAVAVSTEALPTWYSNFNFEGPPMRRKVGLTIAFIWVGERMIWKQKLYELNMLNILYKMMYLK